MRATVERARAGTHFVCAGAWRVGAGVGDASWRARRSASSALEASRDAWPPAMCVDKLPKAALRLALSDGGTDDGAAAGAEVAEERVSRAGRRAVALASPRASARPVP
eukprot:4192253-Prymnesium_polylepis.1